MSGQDHDYNPENEFKAFNLYTELTMHIVFLPWLCEPNTPWDTGIL